VLPRSPNLAYWTAFYTSSRAREDSAHWIFQIGGGKIDTAGYKEPCFGAAGGRHQPFPLLTKLIAPRINNASIAYV